jgi:quinol monooxygenase YgiN
MAFVLTAKWTMKEGEREQVESALRQAAAPTRAEPGCLMWQAHRDPDDPRVLFMYEQYQGRAAYESHLESEHFERFLAYEALLRLEARERAFFETLDYQADD